MYPKSDGVKIMINYEADKVFQRFFNLHKNKYQTI